MAIARNTQELERQIMNKLSEAMNKARTQMFKDMREETADYYSGSAPSIYKRTYALKESPAVSPLQPMTNGYAFLAYLNPAHQYTTGDYPSMWQVLFLADRGRAWRTKGGQMARPTIGNKGFWKRAENKMEKTLNTTMRQYFN